MLAESIYLSAFLMGLLGSTHCAGMCGGIVSALTAGISPKQRLTESTRYLLAYNGGRIGSYAIAGTMMALLGSTLSMMGEGMVIRRGFILLSATLMILLGLYLSGLWPAAILKIEQGGAVIWKRIEPIAQRWIPIRSTSHAWVAGMLWGWLPCGLVYTALLWALSAEHPVQGTLLMVSFGLGTLPALLSIGIFSRKVLQHLQTGWVRATAGIMVAAFGIFQLTTL